MKIAGAWLDAEGTQDVMGALLSAGKEALFVGGCVRNALLGAAVADIDIATDAHPDLVIKIAAESGFRVVPTGIDHGTVTIIAGGVSHEVTTFRRDVQTDGRHAVVAYADSVAEDAARRDFTMNALYARADGTVIDPLKGLPDLAARRVRFVGDPALRIAEDYLRILRFFRFYAVYGDAALGIDAEGLAACAAGSTMIAALSKERIGAEMRKLLAAQDPAPALAAMEQSGVLGQILPGATARVVPLLVHLENGAAASWLCRLAVMGGQDAAGQLRLSRAESATLNVILDELSSFSAPDAVGWRHGAQLATFILLARAASFESPLPDGWSADVKRGACAVFPVAAADLMPALHGPALGAKLLALQDRWLVSGLNLTNEQLLA